MPGGVSSHGSSANTGARSGATKADQRSAASWRGGAIAASTTTSSATRTGAMSPR